MAFAVLQSGAGAGGATSVNFGSVTTAGSTLIIVAVSNINAGACTAGGITLQGGAYGAGHNGDWSGIWFLPNTPAGISSATVTGCHAVGYLEVTGTAGFPQILAGQTTGGRSTAGTTFTCINPGASASNFTVFAYAYDVTNSGTRLSDGTTGTRILSNYGQFGYTTGSGGSSGTMPSGTFDSCAVSFAPASAGGLTPSTVGTAGVYRGNCGAKLQDSNLPTVAQGGILAYEQWLGRPVSFVLDYLMDVPTTWAQFEGGQLDQPPSISNGFTLLSQWGTLPARWTMCLGLPACCGRSIGTGATTWAAEASGASDTHWTALGNNLVAWGMGDAVIRLGREWNGNWYPWSPATTGDTPAHYVAGYQHIVGLLRGIPGSSFTFMWNPGTGTVAGQSGGNLETTAWYPGDTYVDSIGLDFYDWGTYPTLTSTPFAARSAVQQQYNMAQGQLGWDGLNGWAVFAAAHSKPLALPEWGLQQWLTGSNYLGGGDDPFYVQMMATVASYCYMQAMWEDTGMGLFDTDACLRRQLPANGGAGSAIMPDRSRALYLTLFGTPPAGPPGSAGTSVQLGYPLWTDGMEWTGLLSRQLAGGVAVWDANTTATAVNPLGGVLPGPANPMGVAPPTSPGMSVLVNAGYCAVPAPTQGGGVYLFGLTQQAALTVAANPPGVPRTDIVIARVHDIGVSSYADVEIIAGTAGAGQPATPGVAILLGTVTVAPSATTITGGNITDLRSFTAAPGGVLPATTSTAPPLAVGQVMMNTATGGLETVAQPVTYTRTFTTSTSWVAPFTGLVWASGRGGSGGSGGGYQDVRGNNSTSGGGGSGGAEWAGDWIAVTKGTSYPVVIGQNGVRGEGGSNAGTSPSFASAGGDGTVTTFTGDSAATLTCNGGKGGQGAGQQFPAMGGAGGSGSPNAQHQPGGTGGAGARALTSAGGGGGGAGSPGVPGGPGKNATGNTPGAGGTAGPGGGVGGAGGTSTTNGNPGTAPGGGSGGGGADNTKHFQVGAAGNSGNLTLTWTVQPATLTPVLTTLSSDTSTPGQYLSIVSTDHGHGLYPGYNSPYGWGIGAGRGDGSLNVDGDLLPEIRVSFTADGHTDYAFDAKWGIVIPEAAASSTSPSIPWGRCSIIVMIDSTILDTIWLNCAASGGRTYPADAGSFTVYTSSKNGTTPKAGKHTITLAVQTSNTTSGQYSGAHVGDLASVGTSPHAFTGGALSSGYTAALVAEQCYLRATGIPANG